MFGSFYIIIALLFALGSGIPGAWDGNWILPAAYLGMVTLVMIMVTAILASGDGDARQVASRTIRIGEMAALTAFVVGLHVAELGTFVGHYLDLGGELHAFALLVPFLMWSAIVWHAAGRRLQLEGELTGTLANFVSGRLRMSLLNLVPYAILISLLWIISELFPTADAFLHTYWWAQYLGLVGAVTVSSWLVPVVFRYLLPVERIRSGGLYTLLSGVSVRCGQPIDRMYLWNTKTLKLANAFFTGIAPPFRSVFVSDELLQRLNVNEVEAVMAHELGHARHRHLRIMLVFLLTMPLLRVTMGELFSDPSQFPEPCPLDPTSFDATAMPSDVGLVMMVGVIITWVIFGFGFLSRRLERQADEFAARHVGVEAISSALYRLGQLRPATFFKSGWRHFSIAQRLRELMILERSASDPMAARLIAKWRRERRVIVAMTLLLPLVALAFHTNEIIEQSKMAAWHVPFRMAEEARVFGEADDEWKTHMAEADRVLTARLDAAIEAGVVLSHDEAMKIIVPLSGVRAMRDRTIETSFELVRHAITTNALSGIDKQEALRRTTEIVAVAMTAVKNQNLVAYEWLDVMSSDDEME